MLAVLSGLSLATLRPENAVLCRPADSSILGGSLTAESCGSRTCAVVAPPEINGAMEGDEAASAAGALLRSIESPRRPRGRPPAGYVWTGGCYVHLASGEPRCQADTRDRFVQRRRRYERARYWDPRKHVRKQRLARSARKSGRLPKPIQATLEELMAGGPAPGQTTWSPEHAGPAHASPLADLP